MESECQDREKSCSVLVTEQRTAVVSKVELRVADGSFREERKASLAMTERGEIGDSLMVEESSNIRDRQETVVLVA